MITPLPEKNFVLSVLEFAFSSGWHFAGCFLYLLLISYFSYKLLNGFISLTFNLNKFIQLTPQDWEEIKKMNFKEDPSKQNQQK